VDTPRGNKRERKRNKKPSRRSLEEERQRANAQQPTSFPLTTPAFRDRDSATTATVKSLPTPAFRDQDSATVTSTALFRPQPLSQTGWTPYSPSGSTNVVPTLVPAQHYTEVTYTERATPSVPLSAPSPFKLSSASRCGRENQVDSDIESEEEQ
jgi:hypothetical protein